MAQEASPHELGEYFAQHCDASMQTMKLEDIFSHLGSLEISISRPEFELFAQQFRNDQGCITTSQFICLCQHLQNKTAIQQSYERFLREHGVDGSYSLGADELKSALYLVGERIDSEQVQQLLQQLDIDGDGQVGFQDFVANMQRD